jgi:hypothetical protein
LRESIGFKKEEQKKPFLERIADVRS